MTRRLITGKAARALAAIKYVVADDPRYSNPGGKRVSFTDEHGSILITMVYASERDWRSARHTWEAVIHAAIEKLTDGRG